MNRPLHIRPVRESDFDAIATLTNRYILKTTIHFGMTPVTADELRATWASGRERYPFLVAEMSVSVGNAPASPGPVSNFVGYAKAGVWRERAAYAHTAEIGIYVEPAFHGQGCGKTLYAALIQACRERGFHTLVGGITMPNAASEALHVSLGFRHVGTFQEVGRKFDAWHAVAFYQLML